MNVLIYVGHPAQYHFFKHTIRNLKADGCKVKVLIKTKDILENLLKEDGTEYLNIQPKMRRQGAIHILAASFLRTVAVYRAARMFKADILVGTDSSVAQAAFLLGKPSLTTLEDDYSVIRRLAQLTYPFSSRIVVPDVCDVGRWSRKKLSYKGYMKLAYLHPNRFTPDRRIAGSYGMTGRYILLRMVSLEAHHDKGIRGLDKECVIRLAEMARRLGHEICISSEHPLPEELARYGITIQYTDIHHIMAFASLIISDSQSMSVEAAVLGVPSIRYSDFAGRISVLEELEHKYGLTTAIGTGNPQRLLELAEDMLSRDGLGPEYQAKRQRMLEDKIDVTAFLTWFIENYPSSASIMDNDPDYQYRFR